MITEFKQIAANIAASLAATGATVAAIDYFLSRSQKAWVENKNLALWYWLSERNASATIERYKNDFMFKALLKYTMFSFGISEIIFSPLLGLEALGRGILFVLFGVLNIFIVGLILKSEFIYTSSYKTYIRILDFKNPIILFFVSTVLQLIWIIIWFSFVILAHFAFGRFISDDVFSIILAAISVFIVPIFTSYLAICTLSTRFLLVSLASLVYTCFEWFVRKSAESDKGVVLGASAALGAISTFLKSFS